MTPSEHTTRALKLWFKRAVFKYWRMGASPQSLARRHGIKVAVVEQIIREHIR